MKLPIKKDSLKMKKLTLTLTALLLSACATTEIIPLPIVKYDKSDSVALNIAKQTDLLNDFEYGLRTYKSPLRDFTKQDIKDINTALTKSSGGGASKLFGMLSLLTGDLTGVISIAGGLSADLSHTDHHSSQARWIVAENATNFPDELTARKFIFNKITKAVIETFESYGFKVSKYEYDNGLSADYRISLNGVLYRGGMYHKPAILTDEKYYKDLLQKQTVNINGTKGESYTLGFHHIVNKWLVSGISLSPFHEVKEEIAGFNNDEFMAKVTKKLGENYFYYQPNFSQFLTLDNRRYTMTKDITPKIFTNGKRHDFIKPE